MTTLVSVLAACANVGSPDGSDRTVFGTPPIGGSLVYRVHPGEPVDLIIWFRNTSPQPARLRTISLVSQNAAVRTISTSVYNLKRIGYNPATALGILPQECPGKFVPRPVRSLTVPGNAESEWIGVITLRFTAHGKYLVHQIKFSYTQGMNRYWQYYGYSSQIIVSGAPMPGPRPLPSSAVCE